MYISAIIIQAYWRGFKVRNDAWYDKEGEKWFIWYENSAAKRIQMIWRGYKSRQGWHTKPAIYSVLHIEHDKVWIIHQEGVFLKKTPSPSELPKPPEKWLIEQERFKRLLYESFDEFEREQGVAFAHEYQ